MSKTKTKQYYKVVTADMLSVCDMFKLGIKDLPVKYVENKWVAPNMEGTALFVFTDEQEAKIFARRELRNNCYTKKCYVYKCEIRGKKKHPYLCETVKIMRFIQELQKQKSKRQSLVRLMCQYAKSFIPNCTVSVSEIKLTSRIATIDPKY